MAKFGQGRKTKTQSPARALKRGHINALGQNIDAPNSTKYSTKMKDSPFVVRTGKYRTPQNSLTNAQVNELQKDKKK